ncbi:response regulator [Rhodoferax saidenbachensis]|uniref:DNA-binding response regulator n=1 Tax=Rhodoferax saidenbachensis TaxID=1484693 RepID=A0A1P8KE32_9BURK|nr:response regulator [Rhodoferax saidenbachensis]APW44226.1 DNA-binding response regulator [Rhodoferax saidenbachensis]
MKPHILVVDDDPALRELLEEYLGDNELRVTAVANGDAMKKALDESVVDLVVIDLRLNGEDGMQLARGLREKSAIPVIIITGRQEEADRVMGLEMAADDYVTKPFSNRELLARIRAVLRRYQLNPTELSHATSETKRRAYRFAGWELNVLLRRLTTPNGERVELSNGEFNLLLAFCEAPRRVLSRDRLLELSRLHGAEVYDRSIDVSILRLRRKIEENAAEPRYIKTERGAGYLFDTDVDILS